jgi:NDP-sugar pyrophosphorylase family protein
MQAVILCAGKGKRLYPVTEKRSKAMLPILGKPITERVMEQIRAAGIVDFVLVCHPGDEELQDYFGYQTEIDAAVQIVHQGDSLGTAHALQCATGVIKGDFLLSSCDNLTSAEYIARMIEDWKSSPELNALLATMPVERQRLSHVGVVELDGPWVTRIIEKPGPSQAPSLISSLPLYLFSTKVLHYLSRVQLSERGEYEIPDAIQMLVDNHGRVKAMMTNKRLTLTYPEDLIAINRYYLANESPFRNSAAHIGPHTQLDPPIFIGAGVSIGSHCILGPDVYIENDCHIGNRVHITDAVVLQNSRLADGARVVNQIVHANRS